jgi:hypothetical protein
MLLQLEARVSQSKGDNLSSSLSLLPDPLRESIRKVLVPGLAFGDTADRQPLAVRVKACQYTLGARVTRARPWAPSSGSEFGCHRSAGGRCLGPDRSGGSHLGSRLAVIVVGGWPVSGEGPANVDALQQSMRENDQRRAIGPSELRQPIWKLTGPAQLAGALGVDERSTIELIAQVVEATVSRRGQLTLIRVRPTRRTLYADAY